MGAPRLDWDADPCKTELSDDYDQMLHQSLTKIFGERRLTSYQIKDLLRNNNSVIKSILVQQEPRLSTLLSNKQLGKLSLLWLAVLRRYKNSVELLVRSGANVKETFGLAQIGLHRGSTVLHAMVRGYFTSEDERLIRLVTELGLNLEARDDQDLTVLHYAVILDRVELAQMFLDNGADVCCASVHVGTPFTLIADENINNPMVQLIIKALALQKFSQSTSEVPKDVFLIKRHPKLWDYYQNCIIHVYKTKSQRFARSCTFLQLLTQCPCSIAALMRDPEFENRFRLYPLNRFSMYAEDILRAFERARNHYHSMLQLKDVINEAVYRILPDKVVKKVIRYSCVCCCENLRRRKLSLFLHDEIRQGRVELVETLLEKGADVNYTNDYGKTPFLVAASSSEADKLLPLLIKRGADVFAKDRHGGNALHHLASVSGDHTEQARVLIKMGVSLHDVFHDAEFGHQPIHNAVERGGNSELVKLFLDHGADVNARGFQGRTALHSACEKFDQRNIDLLLTAGADVLVKDYKDKTPFALIHDDFMNGPNFGSTIDSMIKALALKKVCQPSIKLKDERIMKYPWLWSYYENCIVNVSRMKFTRFIKSCTFFDLLTRKRCQIAALMRNPAFEANLQLYDLSGFSMYADDIFEAFERARKCYDAMLEQEDVINEAVYYMLPELIVRKMVRHVFESCENVKCK